MNLRKTSDIIKQILNDNNHTEVTYAEKLGRSRQSISYILKDQRPPSKDFLENLCKDFNVSLEIQEEIELYEEWRKTPDRIKIMFMTKEEEAERFKKYFFRMTKMIDLYKCFMKTASTIFGETVINKEDLEELKEMGINLED